MLCLRDCTFLQKLIQKSLLLKIQLIRCQFVESFSVMLHRSLHKSRFSLLMPTVKTLFTTGFFVVSSRKNN